MPSPIVEATLQAAGLSTASNICAQYIDAYRHERPFAFDQYQLVRFLLLTLLTTPPNFVWQQFLEKRFPAYVASVYKRSDEVTELEKAEEGGRTTPRPDAAQQPPLQSAFSLRNTLTKWFIDCITVGALLNTVAFLVIMGVLKHQSASKIWLNVQEQTMPIIVAGYKMWPIASIISFTFIPVRRRIVFLSFVGLLWGIYMSLVAAKV